MNTKQRQLFFGMVVLCLTGVIAVGCGGGPRVKMAPGFENEPMQIVVDANLEGTPDPTSIPPTPTPEPLTLDDNVYSVPSQAFSLYIPQGWTQAFENDTYSRFESPDKTAWFEAAVESTGYQLVQEDFENYTNGMLASLYSQVDNYELLDSQIEEGLCKYQSSFYKEGVQWFVYDFFIQRSQAVYALSFYAYELVWDAYQAGFEEVADSIETRTGYVTDEMVYAFMLKYSSPNDQFNISSPMGWTYKTGQNLIEGAVVDVIESPDGQSAVQIVAYDGTEDLKTVDIGQISIPIIKELNGDDVRIRANEVLFDSRIRTDWQIDAKSVYGFTFFWQDESIVYILTLKYSDKETGAYQNVVNRMGDTFIFTDDN